MKKILVKILLLCTALQVNAQIQNATFSINPTYFEATDEITLTVSNIDPSLWGVNDIYLWAWYYDLNDNPAGDSPTNGTWDNSNESQKFTNNGNGTFSYTFTPATLYGDPDIGRIGVLAKAKNATNVGNGERKTQDYYAEVGTLDVTLNSPTQRNTIVNSGSSILISATANIAANFNLLANGTSVFTQNNVTNFNTNRTINQDTFFELIATDPISGNSVSKTFNVILPPVTQIASVPAGMKDGINFNPANPDEATLVLYAPNKNFVHVIGNFNNNDWRLSNTYLLKKDVSQNRFWIKLTGLTNSNSNVLFQYVVDGQITVADPYSTYVLDENDDAYIDPITFPDIPSYPSGKTQFAISWFKTDETPYNWQINDFQRPPQDNLVIYELLIRDFDEDHSYDAVINKLDYLQFMGITAIELMPVNEFDGNISWGYNPGFHMASDKYYGTKNRLKALVDACHERGIAVILDVVYNHATGQNPYFRMWNDCNGCYGGRATPQNQFFNVTDPNTSFQFFNDIDHESIATQNYIDQLNEYWITEFKIDGYRFDFTKGFTNTVGDGGSYDASRIAILERMYNQIRAVDPTAYIILEHFAPNSEETELINHRATGDPEEPGMLVWSNHNYNYNEATMGYNQNSNFSGISYLSRGWSTASAVGYMESHDEERLNYKNQEYGNSNSNYNVKDFGTAMDRMEMAGAFYFTVPGPKMLWQFGELGYDFSINYCENGTISSDCRVDPKPIPWNINYHTDPDRKDIRDVWSKLIRLKKAEPIFRSANFSMDVANSNGLKKIQITDPSATGSQIKYVTILGNFNIVPQDIIPAFQETGSWFNLIDDTEITVNNPNAPITLQPGEYYVYANEFSVLSTPEFYVDEFYTYPNPSKNSVKFNIDLDSFTIFDITGKLILQQENYNKGEDVFIETLSNGLYLVKAKRNNNLYQLKFIKN